MKNNLTFGLALGLIFPLLAYLAIAFTAIQDALFAHKPVSLYVVAVTINLIVVRFLYRAKKGETAKGIVLATFLAMLTLVVLMREAVFTDAF